MALHLAKSGRESANELVIIYRTRDNLDCRHTARIHNNVVSFPGRMDLLPQVAASSSEGISRTDDMRPLNSGLGRRRLASMSATYAPVTPRAVPSCRSDHFRAKRFCLMISPSSAIPS